MREFKPLTGRARTATWALYALWFTSAFTAGVLAHDAWQFHRLPADGPAQPQLLLTQHAALGIVHTLAFIGAVAAFMPWAWRAARNLEPLNPKGPTLSHWQATLGWFPPVINLFYSISTLRALWHGSVPGHSRLPDTVKAFWAAWIVSSLINLLSSLPSASEAAVYSRNQLLESTYAAIAANLTAMIAVAAMVRIVAAVTKAQQERGSQTSQTERQEQ